MIIIQTNRLSTRYSENLEGFIKVKVDNELYNKQVIIEINPLLTEYLEEKYPEDFI
jgi:hypothetical protein